VKTIEFAYSLISSGQKMTNYEKLFQEQIKHPEFAKAYRDARLEWVLHEFLEMLKEQIDKNEPKEVLLKTIHSMQRRINALQTSS